MNITRRTAATITAITTAVILTPAAALAIIAFTPAPPATPETLDAAICHDLEQQVRYDNLPAEQADIGQLLAAINDDIEQADGVQPTWPIADSIAMLDRVQDMPADVRIGALDILTSRCIEAGHITID